MRIVVQRVRQAAVEVDGETVASIQKGLLVYVGFERGDGEKEVAFMADKILHLRIFADDQQRMNLDIRNIGGQILSISQFTLASRIKKGRRPDFNNAESPVLAEELYQKFNSALARGIKVETGIFGAMMNVVSENDGPVTFIIEKQYGGTGTGSE